MKGKILMRSTRNTLATQDMDEIEKYLYYQFSRPGRGFQAKVREIPDNFLPKKGDHRFMTQEEC